MKNGPALAAFHHRACVAAVPARRSRRLKGLADKRQWEIVSARTKASATHVNRQDGVTWVGLLEWKELTLLLLRFRLGAPLPVLMGSHPWVVGRNAKTCK